MRVNIISNITNGVGLQKDYELLRDLLVEMGHEAVGIQFNHLGHPNASLIAEVNIFLEIVAPKFIELARRNFLVPNPEWYFQGWDQHLPSFEAVLCKTLACEHLFKPKHAKVVFTGFFSRDLYEPSIPREKRFLHVAGKSQTKNTPAVLEAWSKFPIPYPLTVVSEHFTGSVNNVTFLRRITDENLKQQMNSHQFHLMPSMNEGFGHVIHEGFGCGAIVITTNFEPMNEWCAPTELLCGVYGMRQHHSAPLCFVSAEEIRNAVFRAGELSENTILDLRDNARWNFERERELFRTALVGVLNQ